MGSNLNQGDGTPVAVAAVVNQASTEREPGSPGGAARRNGANGPSGTEVDPRAVAAVVDQVNRRLDEICLEAPGHAEHLERSLRFSLLGGGKRIRPVLSMMTARALGSDGHAALDPACAIEMIHTASLVLDDLPCMDDALLRRGRTANHRQFGEDITILAAVSLISESFGLLARAETLAPSVRTHIVTRLSDAIGWRGLSAGQARDLKLPPNGVDRNALEVVHQQKTGALFVCAAEVGGLIAGATEEQITALRAFAADAGLAFQMLDDLLDVASTSQDAGKDVQQDLGKTSFATLLSPAELHAEAHRLIDRSEQALAPLGENAAPLIALSRMMAKSFEGQLVGKP